MTDTELTKMLRSSANRVVNYAADRIETLTAERDQWIAHAKNAVWADSEELKQAEAERDRAERMRDVAVQAATQFLVKLSDLEADNARLLEALTDAGTYIDKGQDKMAFNIIRAVLKGETP